MALLPKPFNAYEVDPSGPSQQLPVSDAKGHPVIITASEFKASRSNANNGYVEFTLEIVDGPNKGATGPWRLNLFHDNAQTVDIANHRLSALCHVTGQMLVSDTSQLHNIPFRAVVSAKPFKNDKGEEIQGTEVKGVLDINGERAGKQGAAPAPQAAPQFAQQPQAAPQGAPAWGQQAQHPAPAPVPQQAQPVWNAQPAPGGAAPAPWGPK